MQGFYAEHEETRKALAESESRVKAMALLHQNIYQTKDLVDFNFTIYIEQIAKQVAHSFQNTRHVHLTTELDPVHLELDRATLIGLMVNELLTNAYRHGYEDGDEGEVLLRIRLAGMHWHNQVRRWLLVHHW